MANFFVAISHGNRVVMCHHHEWKITGDNFVRFVIDEQFPAAFERTKTILVKIDGSKQLLTICLQYILCIPPPPCINVQNIH